MKKLIFLLILLVFISPVFAQSNLENPSLYYVNVSIERIFPSNQGYVIQYRTQNGFATIGVPNSWFNDPAGRADMVRLPRGPNWPTMSIFYSDGEFSHVRLYVHAVKSHNTWGSIPQGTDVSRFFPEDESFNIQF